MSKQYVIPNLPLFQRCRELHEEIAHLRAALPESEVIAALKRTDFSQLPPDQQRLAKRILRDKADLAAKEAELETLAVQAEEAAQLLSNKNLRRITQLYCIDGMSWSDLLKCCPCGVRTVGRYVSALKKHDEETDPVRADGR